MDIAHQLSHELLRQDFVREQMAPDELDRYKMIACHYARVENALSVLSDMRSNTSYIYYGGFSKTLGLTKAGKTDEVCSIWEDEILKLAHPDDLKGKYIWESSVSFISSNDCRKRDVLISFLWINYACATRQAISCQSPIDFSICRTPQATTAYAWPFVCTRLNCSNPRQPVSPSTH